MRKYILPFTIYFFHTALSALTSGDFNYDLINGDTEVEITEYTGSEIHLTIPDTIDGKSVTSIGELAFEEASVETVVFPSTLTNISTEAFYYSALTAITIPDSVLTIGQSAFDDCYNVTSLTLSGNLETIEANAFSSLAITSLTIPDSVITIESGAFNSCGKLANITLPTALESIGRSAFYGAAIDSIDIPENVNFIGSYAFQSCSHLLSIDVNAGNLDYSSIDGVLFNADITTLHQYPGAKSGAYMTPDSVVSIDAYAFAYTPLLTEVSIPSVTILEEWTFAYCTDLHTVTLPSNLISIGEHCFRNCEKLTDIGLPATLTSLAKGVFDGCSELPRIHLPDGITAIPADVFLQCTKLDTITLPAGLISIGNFAFYNCKVLTRITFPASLTSIGKVAFNNADTLVPIFLGNAPSTNSSSVIFQNTPGTLTVYYMSGATGFDTTWENKQTVALDAASFSTASAWLLQYDLDYDADIHTDLNGDGISLLMAYALDLDPTQNLADEMPILTHGNGTTSITYFADTQGISYIVQASQDLVDWDSFTVSYTELDTDNQQTASFNSTEFSQLFLRLSISEE